VDEWRYVVDSGANVLLEGSDRAIDRVVTVPRRQSLTPVRGRQPP
jgi:hypothetical protein